MNKYEQRVNELEGEFVYAYSGEAPVVVSEEELQGIELAVGQSLPDDYREFLRDFGGYSFFVSYPLRRTSAQVPEGSLSTFYGFKLGTTLDLLARYKNDLANQVIGPELLPIAHDAADNQVCLFLSGSQSGSIHFWYAEAAKSPYDYTNMYSIADSFDEFMQLLRKDE